MGFSTRAPEHNSCKFVVVVVVVVSFGFPMVVCTSAPERNSCNFVSLFGFPMGFAHRRRNVVPAKLFVLRILKRRFKFLG